MADNDFLERFRNLATAGLLVLAEPRYTASTHAIAEHFGDLALAFRTADPDLLRRTLAPATRQAFREAMNTAAEFEDRLFAALYDSPASPE